MIDKDELNELEYCVANDPEALDKIKPEKILELISSFREMAEQGVKAGMEGVNLAIENQRLKAENQNLHIKVNKSRGGMM